MIRSRSMLFLLATAALVPTACARDGEPAKPAAAPAAKPVAANEPAVVKTLRSQGVEFMGTFETPVGLTGYAGVAGQRPLGVYVSKDGQYAVVGTLVNAQGEDVSAAKLKELVSAPLGAQAWSKVEASHWVADGKADAPRVIYAFSDPNCPYCNHFWEAARPWVESGKVQIREILVGVIREDSANKAAAILGAASPEQALLENERNFAKGGIKPLPTVPADVQAKLRANELLMLELGFQGTPGILFKDVDGSVQMRSGMPQGEDLAKVLGPR
ncbi:thiol:disulfide interchange protein DsbG [Stenotrophomonas sp. SY1]|uniref:thiol:disulfide interchange protein DsbG n=1 Tax=Stenotrophomonas sp. SY1 TaxID=477235 RepID=UPI001E654700|nr:thiol:disulfide interchange protein DsbG [Stenotrophomonas sp. SY1]MCD9087585.1 thiol:disulfide interchange protein DsbG [Stenotrophomonas sp. SY1]